MSGRHPQLVCQEVHGDGACLFRAAALSWCFARTGLNLGRGAAMGSERTLADAALNRLAQILRDATVGTLCTDHDPDPAALRAILDRCVKVVRESGLESADPEAWAKVRREQDELRHRPQVANRKKEVMEGVDAETVASSGLRGAESLAGYCRRMRSDSEWGGEGELAVLARRVLVQPVVVWQRARRLPAAPQGVGELWALRPLRSWAGGGGPSLHLHYTGDHYEALLPVLRPGCGRARDQATTRYVTYSP